MVWCATPSARRCRRPRAIPSIRLIINDKYGTDAVRFALLISAAPGGDIALSEDRIDALKAFANKIWNASRLVVQQAS